MRVLMVNNGIFPKVIGGAEIYMGTLAKELNRRGHEVYIAYPEYNMRTFNWKVLSEKWNDGIIVNKIILPRIDIFKSIFKYGLALGSYFVDVPVVAFSKLVKMINPDIIHFHNISWWRSPKILRIPKYFGVPSVITLHDYWFLCPLSTLYHYTGTPCNGPNPIKCKECWIGTVTPNNIVKKIFSITVKESQFSVRYRTWGSFLDDVNLIISPSSFLGNLLTFHYKNLRDKVIYLENGYDLNMFKGFKKEKKDTSKIIFGFAGSVIPIKGVHILIDAFLEVPEDKAELRVYGWYNPKSPYVKSLFKKIRGKSNIRFLGRYEDPKIPFSEIDVLVFPSITYENCPLVLAEARATKTPVIASNLGAIPEFVEDGETGLLFEPDNPRDLHEKIMRVVDNLSLIEKFKVNIKPPKSMEEYAEEITNVYSFLLEE